MTQQPILETARLTLRPFHQGDAARLRELAGMREIADTMISIPHPYLAGMAEQWIAAQPDAFREGREAHYAIQRKAAPEMLGALELRAIDAEHSQAELSFWIGKEWWGRGYALEATLALVDFGFDRLGLNRLCAHHMVRNPASGRVLEKAGFRPEGLLRQRVRKWNLFEDVILMARLRQDLQPGETRTGPA